MSISSRSSWRHYPQAQHLWDCTESSSGQPPSESKWAGCREEGFGCAPDPNCRQGISTNHSPNTERRAEATASRAANVTSPACWGWALFSIRAWWLPSVVTFQSASSGWMAAPLIYQVASPTGTASLSVQEKETCVPALTEASCGGSRTSKRQPVETEWMNIYKVG